jgi:hypothetical protein
MTRTSCRRAKSSVLATSEAPRKGAVAAAERAVVAAAEEWADMGGWWLTGERLLVAVATLRRARGRR